MSKRTLVFFSLAAMLVCSLLIISSNAAGGPKDRHYGPFASTSPDNGTCGIWAIDTFDRVFNVHDNGDGTFSVDEQFKNGSFVTIGGSSQTISPSAMYPSRSTQPTTPRLCMAAFGNCCTNFGTSG